MRSERIKQLGLSYKCHKVCSVLVLSIRMIDTYLYVSWRCVDRVSWLIAFFADGDVEAC